MKMRTVSYEDSLFFCMTCWFLDSLVPSLSPSCALPRGLLVWSQSHLSVRILNSSFPSLSYSPPLPDETRVNVIVSQRKSMIIKYSLLIQTDCFFSSLSFLTLPLSLYFTLNLTCRTIGSGTISTSTPRSYFEAGLGESARRISTPS